MMGKFNMDHWYIDFLFRWFRSITCYLLYLFASTYTKSSGPTYRL